MPKYATGDACYNRGIPFRLKWFLNDGAQAEPKIVGNKAFCFRDSRCIPTSIFHPVAVFISPNLDSGEVLTP